LPSTTFLPRDITSLVVKHHIRSRPMDASTKSDPVVTFLVEAFTLLAIAILVTSLRTYSRITLVGIRRFEADDYLVLVGVVFHSLETGCAYGSAVLARGLANNSMTDEQRATLDPNSEEYHARVLGSKLQIVGYSLYSVLLWSLKAAMCNFYLRLAVSNTLHKLDSKAAFTR
jgi:hypothetical protein